MSSLGAPRRPSDPAGGGDNNRADTWTQSACERNLEWVRKRVNGRREPPLRRARVCLEPLGASRSEEHTSELQSQSNLVCRLLLEKKNKAHTYPTRTPCASRPYRTLSSCVHSAL